MQLVKFWVLIFFWLFVCLFIFLKVSDNRLPLLMNVIINKSKIKLTYYKQDSDIAMKIFVTGFQQLSSIFSLYLNIRHFFPNFLGLKVQTDLKEPTTCACYGHCSNYKVILLHLTVKAKTMWWFKREWPHRLKGNNTHYQEGWPCWNKCGFVEEMCRGGQALRSQKLKPDQDSHFHFLLPQDADVELSVPCP